MKKRIWVAAALGVAMLCGTWTPAAFQGTKVADAAMSADVVTVRALLIAGEDVNSPQGDGMTALHWAARRGDTEMVRMLIAAGGNLRASTRLGGYTPLMLASQAGHATAIDALVGAGADAKGTTEIGRA